MKKLLEIFRHNAKAGTYVRLHGLNNALYNDLEGLVVKKEMKKAYVQLAGTRKIINVLCKDITVKFTFKVQVNET